MSREKSACQIALGLGSRIAKFNQNAIAILTAKINTILRAEPSQFVSLLKLVINQAAAVMLEAPPSNDRQNLLTRNDTSNEPAAIPGSV